MPAIRGKSDLFDSLHLLKIFISGIIVFQTIFWFYKTLGGIYEQKLFVCK